MAEAIPDDLQRILADRDCRAHADLRDRAAFVYVTGAYPSHLRTPTNRALTLISESAPDANGERRIVDEVAVRPRLDHHPMVRRVQTFVAEGYRIKVSRGPNARRPYGKVLVFKDVDRRTVQIDGAVRDGWD